MRILTEGHLIGAPGDLILDTESLKWSRDGEAQFRLTGAPTVEPDSADALLRLERVGIDLSPPRRWDAIAKQINCDRPCWSMMMPRATYRDWLKSITRTISKCLSIADSGYHGGTFKDTSRVLQRLQPALIDRSALDSLAEEGKLRSGEVYKSFLPRSNGLLDVVSYDRFSTRTGRLTVKSGPQILTLPKGARSIFRSSFDGGSIVILDYVSFEAHLTLAFAGCDVAGDVYEHVSHQLYDGEIDRNRVKIAVLGMMFGASDAVIGRALGLTGGELQAAVDDLRRHFRVRELRDMLLSKLDADSCIRSHYGRRVHVPEGKRHAIVNSFIQSTAVDAAMLGFGAVLDGLGDLCKPLFVIHDAIMLDLSPEGLKKLSSVLGEAERISGLDVTFPCRAEFLYSH